MKRHKKLWERVVSLGNLVEAARSAMRGKRGKAAGASFFAQWEREVVCLERELRDGSYRPGDYHYFTITEPKERVVAAAPFRDRVVHHALVRVKGYLRYVDDFVLFGDDRKVLKRQGESCRERLRGEGLEIHPDKYRLVHTAHGLDFCGYVVRADGRVRVRNANARRFHRKLRHMRRELRTGRRSAEEVRCSVRAWVAHAEHAQSWRLRAAVLGS